MKMHITARSKFYQFTLLMTLSCPVVLAACGGATSVEEIPLPEQQTLTQVQTGSEEQTNNNQQTITQEQTASEQQTGTGQEATTDPDSATNQETANQQDPTTDQEASLDPEPDTDQQVDFDPDSYTGAVIPIELQSVKQEDDMYPYRRQGAFSSVLKDCAVGDSICKLEKLPFIGQVNSNPTVEDVMQRVVVTHDWMGERFELMLSRMPTETIRLFGPVTSIVVGSSTRSLYSSSRARIMIPSNLMWVNESERATVSSWLRYPFSSARGLSFSYTYAHILSDGTFLSPAEVSPDGLRVFKNVEHYFLETLIHELGHANDFLQYNKVADAPLNQSPLEYISSLYSSATAQRLYADPSLTNTNVEPLSSVAHLMRNGGDTTAENETLTAETAGAIMGSEGKVTLYSYFTRREDVAELFTATLMKYYYGATTNVAYIDQANYFDYSPCSFSASWGEQNRVASPLVRPRAEFVTRTIFPDLPSLDQFFATGIGIATSLLPDQGICGAQNSP